MTIHRDTAPTPQQPQWRRAQRCSPAGDNCVEVRLRAEEVDIRDSKATHRTFTVSRAAWRALLADLAQQPRA